MTLTDLILTRSGAIGAAFGPHRPVDEKGEKIPLYIGSVKTNIGHTEGTSGLAGVIKAVLALERGAIPPNMYFENPNPQIDLEGWNLKVPTELIPWPTEGLRRISVNSFGFGGTNGHVILDDSYNYLTSRGLKASHRTSPKPALDWHTNLSNGNAKEDTEKLNGTNGTSTTEKHRPRVFLWSTHEENIAGKSGAAYAEHLAQRKEEDEESFLNNLAYTLTTRRTMLPWKSFLVADSLSDLVEKVAATRQKPVRPTQNETRTAFVFTGQGAQWFAMGRELSVYPVFQKRMEEANLFIKQLGADWSLIEELKKDEKESRINESLVSQTACTAIQLALVDLLASWGARPQKVIGHSSGEIAAAYTAGILPAESALKAAYFRGLHSSHVKDKLPNADGAMMAVGLSEVEGQERIATLDPALGKAFVACVNSPTNITVSGDRPALEALSETLQKDSVFVRFLKVSTAYHSHHMEAVAADYEQSLAGMEVNPVSTEVEMISTVTGEPITEADILGPKYWSKNMVGCVRFSDGLQVLCTPRQTAKRARRGIRNQAAVDVLVEVGPHAALAGPIKQILGVPALEKSGIVYKSVLSRGQDARVTAMEAATFLFAKGSEIDLFKVNFPEGTKVKPQVVVDLPTYFWNHTKRHWVEGRLSHEHRFRRHGRTDFLGYPTEDWNPMEPRWRNIVRLREQPWIKGHVVQGSYIYPGAGFMCMAVEAMFHLRQQPEYTAPTGNFVGYRIKDMKISRALIVPATDDGVETIFSMRQYKESSSTFSNVWHEFRIFSWSPDGWAEHAHGLISAVHESGTSTTSKHPYLPRLEGILAAKEFSYSRTAENMYDVVGNVGLNYDEAFRSMTGELQSNDDGAKGTVTIFDTKSLMPFEHEYPHVVHPSTMDCFIQMLFPALLHGTNVCNSPYLPVSIEELFVDGTISNEPGHKFTCAATADSTGYREVTSDVLVVDEATGTPRVSFKNVLCSSLEAGGSHDADDEGRSAVKKLTFHSTWQPDPDLLPRAAGDEIMREHIPVPDDVKRVSELETISYYYYYQVLQKIKESQVVAMKPHHQKFFRYMQREHSRVVAHDMPHQTPEWEQFDDPAIAQEVEALAARLETTGIDAELITRVGRKLDKVLTGDVDPLALMLEDELLYKYYEGVLGYDILHRYATMISAKNPDMKFLEIGGGTGGATAPILAAMGGNNGRYPRFQSYTFTDISSGFFEEAETKFKDWQGLVEYRRLNIEEDPVDQGFGEGQYDVVVAASVLHATASIDKTLAHTRKLLKPGGRLILVEISNNLNQVFLLFGCLPGWWMSEESYRQWGPTLTEQGWEDALKRNGFSSFTLAAPDNVVREDEMGRVFSCVAVEQPAPSSPLSSSIQSVTLVTDDKSPSKEFEQALEQRLTGLSIPVQKTALKDVSNVSLANSYVVSLAEVDRSVTKDMTQVEFDAIKYILRSSEGLMWVTEGGASTSKDNKPESAIFHGIARSLRTENEAFPIVSADFASINRKNISSTADQLLILLQPVLRDPLAQDPDYWHDGSNWQINRCLESVELNCDIHNRLHNESAGVEKAEEQPFYQADRPLKLKIETPGLLDTLVFEDDLQVAEPLHPDEVEIEVKSSGVNFRDIMICTGQMSDTSLGLECGGIVHKVGANVTSLKVGQRVTAWTYGNYRNYVRTWADLAKPIPDDMEFSVAASIPIIFSTVIYGLQHVARLQRGESVLIHAAAGGVGQAAILLAQLIGADIFVTVGTQAKRDLIKREFGIPDDRIFNSRDLSFAEDVKRATGGRGVDVVLNSLAGDALSATWECIARFGRFVEMGKKDFIDNRRLEMSTFLRNVTFASIDLITVFSYNPRLAGQLLSEAVDMISAKSLRPIPSITTFTFSQFEEAFRHMQAGKHVGKVVMVPQKDDVVKVNCLFSVQNIGHPTNKYEQALPRSNVEYTFPADGSYLITGFGGLGHSMAKWMASRGAKNLIFASRSGVSRPAVRDLVEELKASGVRVEVLPVDITDRAALESHLKNTLQDSTMPPLRGVIQAAMVLEDQIFDGMPLESFNKGLRPKVQGSWNLHELTLDQPLDFFIILASAIGVLGNSSQANYSAGNAYEDALAQYRRAHGLPAVSIDLGMMLGVGAVAEDESGAIRRNLERKGFVGIEEPEFLTMLEVAIQDDTHKQGHQLEHGQMITGIQTLPVVGEDGVPADEPFWKSSPVFSHLRKLNARSSANANNANAQSTQALLKAALSLNDVVTVILNAILVKLSRSLMIEVAELDPSRPTSAFGVDSLIAVELRNWFQKEMKADIPVFEILQANSLQVLAFRVAEKSTLVENSLKEGQ